MINLVSIIVPVYGTEAYLSACIESLCKQTYDNIQIILVDDQSPDKCPEICDDYAKRDTRIIVVHQHNKGVSGARNTGIEHADGNYIMFVDSDDELEANAVEILLKDIVEYKAQIASASKSILNNDVVLYNNGDDGSLRVYEGEKMIKRSLDYDGYTRSLHSKLFDKEFVKDIRFVEGHNINEDGYFLFECYTILP